MNRQPARFATHPSSSRQRLQWTLAPLAVVPTASAVGEIIRGPQGVPGGSPEVIPTADSALRYANVFKLGGSDQIKVLV